MSLTIVSPNDRSEVRCFTILRLLGRLTLLVAISLSPPNVEASASPGLTGRVVFHPYEVPLENVQVELLVDGKLIHITTTDEDGQYFFTDVQNGEVELVHSGKGLTRVTVDAGKYVYPREHKLYVAMRAVLEARRHAFAPPSPW